MPARKIENNMNACLEFDLRRSQLLAQFLPAWGIPSMRQSYILDHQGQSYSLEFYLFAGEDADQVSRFVSVGLSALPSCKQELLLVLPADLAEQESDSIFAYLLLQARLTILQRREFEQSYMAQQSGLPALPNNWPQWLLFDRAYSEIDTVQKIFVGLQAVELAWLVPVFEHEAQIIKSQGLDAFDAAVAQAEINLLEPLRQSCG